MFARELRYRGTAQPSLITQIIPLRHSDAAHHLVTCVCARRVLNAGINLCHQWDFVPFFPSSSHVIKLHVDVVSACISNLVSYQQKQVRAVLLCAWKGEQRGL